MSNYLHGIEIKEGEKKVVISAGDTAIIALVGTAPKGAVNQVKLITTADAGKMEYGSDIEGFTIPAALEVIFSHINAKVLVVNVLEAAKATALMEEDGKMTRSEAGVVATNIYKATIPAAVDYSAQIIAGIEMMQNVDDTIGLKPNIIIVPGYSQITTIHTKMIYVADKLNGYAAIDMVAADVQAALTLRNSGDFAITSPAAVLCYPQVVRYNQNEKNDNPCGLSVWWAAAKALRDTLSGYHLSPSNTELVGVKGLNAAISSSLTDSSADTNLLNGQGIVTVFRKSGSGSRLWGNWTAAFPTDQITDAMIAPRAVRMAIREALIDATLQRIDKTPTMLAIDLVAGDVNAFLRTLKGQGYIESGECLFDADKNPSAEVSRGRLTWTLTVKYAASLERMTFEEITEY